MNVEGLVRDPDKVDALLGELDRLARNQGCEYGLPMHDSQNQAQLREAVYRWACGVSAPQKGE
jgi:hypothetical protein